MIPEGVLRRGALGLAVLVVLVFIGLAFEGIFDLLDDRRATDRFLTRQVIVNDLDQIDHRIVDKERAKCEERFFKDLVRTLRTDPRPEAVENVQGCFRAEDAEALARLYEKRDVLVEQLRVIDEQFPPPPSAVHP